MLYTVYQITHQESGKVYIGKHQTLDPNDGYLGSGKLIKNAVKKHGLSAFTKEVLHVFETEPEMNAKEAELVTEEFCARDDTYNLCPGGQGGWGYLNSEEGVAKRKAAIDKWALHGRARRWTDVSSEDLESFRLASSIRAKRTGLGKSNHWNGRIHSAETKAKMSEAKKAKYIGGQNSQYGSMWTTDGVSSKKISKGESIPEGWVRGRKMG